MKTLRYLTLLPFAVSAACGGSSEFKENDRSPSVPLEELPERYAGAQCALFERCTGLFFDLFFSLEDCETLASRQFRDGGFAELEQAIEGERVGYDAKKAARCLEMIATRECSEGSLRDIPECEEALAGTVPEGEACSIDAECEGSAICEVTDACPGTCVDRYGAGFACERDDECADGLVCSEATRLCATPKVEGEPCGGGIEAQCELGLACIGESRDDGRTGTCRPFDELETARVNEVCDLEAGILCEPGLSCVIVALEGPTFSCRAVPALGGACGLGIPEHCPAGEYCALTAAEVVTGTLESECIPLPASGEPCADRAPFNGILAQCEAYSRCDASTGDCLGLRNLGETCSSDALCYSRQCEAGGCAARGCQ